MTLQRYSIMHRQHQNMRQQGVVLFFALIGLLVMSLASVALVRSVDTNNAIAGNLAFKQAATASADAGIEAAIAMLISMRDAPANSGKKVLNNATHTFNKTDTANPGYHSNTIPTLTLTDTATWNGVNNRSLPMDTSGNTVQYIMQRMCRNANVAMQDADCLYASALDDTGEQSIKAVQDVCEGPGCYSGSQTPQIRVTVRVAGPKNTISYVQAFIY